MQQLPQAGQGYKVPPQNIEIEKAVLGALLIESKVIPTVMHLLKEDLFYMDANRAIFKAIHDMHMTSNPIDMLTVMAWLKKKGSLGKVVQPSYLTEVVDNINSASHIEAHCRELQELSIKRYIITATQQIMKKAWEDNSDGLALLGDFAKVSDDAHKFINQGSITKFSDSYRQYIKSVGEAMQSKNNITGIPSPIHKINLLTGGWQNSELIVKASRPGMGKTADMVTEVVHMAFTLNIPILIFSLEMSAVQLIGRIVSQLALLNGQLLKTGKISKEQFQEVQDRTKILASEQADNNLHINDTPALSIYEVTAIAKMYWHKYGIKMIFIDYLQLVTNPEKGLIREQQVAITARSLKNLAKSLDIPVTAYSQLGRSVEIKGGNKKPHLSALRESGEIENAADMVIMIYRWEYYGIAQDDNGQDSKGKALFLFEKFRGGSRTDIELGYIGEFTMFCNESQRLDYMNAADKTVPNYSQPVPQALPEINNDEELPF